MKDYEVQQLEQTAQQCGVVELTVEDLEQLVVEEIVLDLPDEPEDLPAAA